MNYSSWNYTSAVVQPFINLTILNVLKLVIASCNLLLGLPLYLYILSFIARGKEGGIASEFFTFNLTVCETVFCLNSIFFILGHFYSHFLMLHKFFLGLGITGRPLFQCLICVERYLAVVHPVMFLKFKPLRYKIFCAVFVWIVVFGSCLCTNLTFTFSIKNANTWFYMVQFMVFLSVQLFCCLAVLRVLKQSGPGERGREREEENNMKKRAFYIIVISTVTTLIMFIPFTVTGILTIMQKDVSLIWFISFCCFILSAYVHPFLYLKRLGKT